MQRDKNKISIFGLGYVGCVLSVCFAQKKFNVIGVDIDPIKIKTINSGRSPIVEPKLDFLIRKTVGNGSFRATEDVDSAIAESNISIVCVGTPSLPDGNINYIYLKKVVREIATALRRKKAGHILVVKSTVLPGTMDSVVKPILIKTCGKKIFRNITLCYNPEFLREGMAIADFFHPPKTIIGAYNGKIGQSLMSLLYGDIPGEKIVTGIKISETIKYVDNTFHALKVAFANEIGRFCKSLDIDSGKVMEIFCLDRKLNLSPYYLKPGKPFGGSCLPKDIKALVYTAGEKKLELPIISSILYSNDIHARSIVKFISSLGKRKIGIIGLSFKENTDDLRHSPIVGIAKSLIDKGCKLSIFDKNLSLAEIFGSNKKYILKYIPRISSLLVGDVKNLIKSSEIIILANREKTTPVLSGIPKNKIIIDLVGANKKNSGGNYKTFC